MIEIIEKYLEMSSNVGNKRIKNLGKKTKIEQATIMHLKYKFYNNTKCLSTKDRLKIKTLKNKYGNHFYDLAILLYAIDYFNNQKKSEKLRIAIAKEKLKKRVLSIKKKTLESRINILFPEIAFYRKMNLPWIEIAKLLKHDHRRMFENYKIDPSYLRKIYNKIIYQKNND